MFKKIYAICLDAYPETPELIKLMTDRKMSRSELICSGAFTCTTITSMISGCIGTEIINGGIGYETYYKPDFFKWRPGNCLTERLIHSNLSVYVHNHVPWFSKVIGGKPISEEEQKRHYRDHTVDQNGCKILKSESPFAVSKIDPQTRVIYSSTNPDITLNTFLKWNFPEEKSKFYSNEKKFINHIQHQKFNGLFFTDLCHWHEYCYYKEGQIKSNTPITQSDALNDTLKWLSNWDFNEPNSIFFIFADHSHRVNSYLDPQSYITWVYYKDNISTSKLNPMISSNDFYHLVDFIFKLKPAVSKPSKWISNPIGSYNPHRIYAVEDGRANAIIKDKSSAYGRCTLLSGNIFLSITKLTDNTNNPAKIYVFISNLSNKYTYSAYLYDTLDGKYIDHFSIKCDGPLGDRHQIKDQVIYPMTPEILAKAKELLRTI